MKLNQVLLILLVIVGIVMIIMGVKANMKPPILTGVGFFIIALLFQSNSKK